ncbi:MAG: MerR family transcriptional regulator [Bacillota bacterium]|nr:MerR family transcriptional regulator [Bacillota bacterium]
MNTVEVAKLLGVSSSTVQRWVKQLDLPMERNDRGHYSFNEGDINILKTIQEQVQNGTLLQEIAVAKEQKVRKGTGKNVENEQIFESLLFKVNDLERSVNEKADSVASYQLLQHRQEIEELQKTVTELNVRIEKLEAGQKEGKMTPFDQPLISDQMMVNRKQKKKNIISMLLGN